MAIDGTTARREPTLSAARWPGLPRGRTVARAALVAALLALAAGVLYAHEPTCPGPAGPAPDPSASVASGGAPSPVPGRRALPPGHVGVAVRLTEPAALAVVQPGVLVDLLAVPAAGASRVRGSTLVAARALVLDVVRADAAEGTPALYLALQPDQAQRTVEMPENTRFTIIVR
jgi:hypothetical protein